jgi:acetyl esterase/lipase
MADTFFSGYAYLDSNDNRELDEDDAPLQGAMFYVLGFRDETDARGHALVTIPGGWDKPAQASMAPPEGSGYELIGPQEVVLQQGVQNSAEFLFAEPSGTPTGNHSTTEPQPGASDQPAASPEPGTMEIDLTYCTTQEGVKLEMDVYYPHTMNGPAPLVLYVHGGGWTGGDKSDGAGLLFAPPLRVKGYVIAAINYRLSPTYKFPAHIEDVRCAVRHLRANAERYNLDPERFGALGGSAGGHLVSLLATTGDNTAWEPESYLEAHASESNSVQAVVDLFGTTDLTQLLANGEHRLTRQVFGIGEDLGPPPELYSPVEYISLDTPPFLILHGEEDDTVPPEQSEILYEQLSAAGVPATLVMVKNAGHGLQSVDGEIDPSLQELRKMVVQFFDQHLKTNN